MRTLGSSAGMTLIEIIISVALFVILTSLGLFVGLDFYRTFSINSEQDVLVSILRKARSDSLNNKHQLSAGLRITQHGYTYFQGDTYAARNPQYDQVYSISPSISLSGASEVVFQKLSGDATNATITLSATNATRTITINSAGQINW